MSNMSLLVHVRVASRCRLVLSTAVTSVPGMDRARARLTAGVLIRERAGYLRRILYEFIPIQSVRVTPVTLLTSRTVNNTKCIFCARTGADIKITREHTFSDWINEVLPVAIIGPDITYERSIQHGPQAGTVNTWPAKVVADHTIRAVCKDCNNGWMKRWEDAAYRSSSR